MSTLRIVFCGTPEFACPSLQALQDDPAFEITSVITQPDRPAGRGKKLMSPPVKILAEKLKIPVLQPEDISTFHCSLFTFHYLVVVAYGQILSKELLALPRIAPVNVHPSLLPRWRGASPIQNAILAGDSETGVTIQRIAPKLDTGPILRQERVAIAPRETRRSLEEKLARLGAELLRKTLKEPLHETLQDEKLATECKKLTREMGNVNPATMIAEEIDRRVRALVPWPGVRARTKDLGFGTKDEEIKLIETSLKSHPDAIEIPCAQHSKLYIVKIQPPGKQEMSGSDFARGRRPSTRSARSG